MRLDLDPRLPADGNFARLIARLFEVLRLSAQANNLRADGFCFPSQSVSANFTMQTETVLFVSAAGAARAITLPAPAAVVGKVIAIRKTDAGANNVTLTPPSGQIDGAASLVLTAAAPRAMLASDGTNYFTL